MTVAVWLHAFRYFTSFWICQYSGGSSEESGPRSMKSSSSSDSEEDMSYFSSSCSCMWRDLVVADADFDVGICLGLTDF